MQEDQKLHQQQQEEGNLLCHTKPIQFFNQENFTITIEHGEEYPNDNNNIINLDEDEKDEIMYLTIASESEEYKDIKYTAKIYIDDEIDNQPTFSKFYEDNQEEIGLQLSKFFDDGMYKVQKGRNNNQILLIFEQNKILKKKEIIQSFQFVLNQEKIENNNKVELDILELKSYFNQKFETLQQKEPQNNQNLEEKINNQLQKSTENNNKIIQSLEKKVENLANQLENTNQKQELQLQQILNILEYNNQKKEFVSENQINKSIINNNNQQVEDLQEQKVQQEIENQDKFYLNKQSMDILEQKIYQNQNRNQNQNDQQIQDKNNQPELGEIMEKLQQLQEKVIKNMDNNQNLEKSFKDEIKKQCNIIENNLNENLMMTGHKVDNNLKKLNYVQELIQTDVYIKYFHNKSHIQKNPKFLFNYAPSTILSNNLDYNDQKFKDLKNQITILDEPLQALFILKSMPDEHKNKLNPKQLMKPFDIKKKKVIDFKNELQGKENCLILLKIKQNQNSQYQYFAAYVPDKEAFDQSEETKWIKTKQNDINDYPYLLDLNQYHKRTYYNKEWSAYGINNNFFIIFNGDFQISDEYNNYNFCFALNDDKYKSNLIEENNNQKRHKNVKVYCGEMEVIQLF